MLAMLASRRDAAATLTVRHGDSTGEPVAGSSRWWAGPWPVCHIRTVTLEVARPPSRMAMQGAVGAEVGPVVVGDEDRPATVGRRARDGDVASERHEHATPPDPSVAAAAARSAARPLAVAPRSRSTPPGSRTVPAARSRCTSCQPGNGDRWTRRGRAGRPPRRSRGRSRAPGRGAPGGVDSASGEAAARRAASRAVNSSGEMATGRPPERLRDRSSESRGSGCTCGRRRRGRGPRRRWPRPGRWGRRRPRGRWCRAPASMRRCS